ncbi:hypothetical protein PTTG_29018 [Puccinia triticina 1-1 BBBD Race 1]|uniref:DUF6589 domain-containing protein n=1 Tax=Puccinia triticina (isolate 1-1 / race 1 (BBBD)) TaxID=630390 RepID=A0A180G786_PUCT1|nr:hypothetical protein PTTG_29018 [Puccinia triticina 1-1 BBBD Race 1]
MANRAHVPLQADQLKLSSETIQDWVEVTSERFCSDFATIVEANSAMKDGDYGRLMFMWQRWAVMSQGIGGMPHYSKHLPKLIVLLNHILPESLSQLVLNTLLLSPKGKPGHFMATDFYLEVQNYWLKYFFNHSGIGTDIERLKEVFSSNISLLQYLLQLLKLESGSEVIPQSHKNMLTLDSINNFLCMAESERLGQTPPDGATDEAIDDFYLNGIAKMQKEFFQSGLNRFKPYSQGIMSMYDEDDVQHEAEEKEITTGLEHEYLNDESSESIEM